VNIRKIVGIVSLAVAVVAAFVAFPYAALVLALLGIVVGLGVPADAQVRVLASALVLSLLGHAFDTIPAIGPYVGAIILNIGIGLAGAALTIVFKNIYLRLTE
jgi:hypothetical protein